MRRGLGQGGTLSDAVSVLQSQLEAGMSGKEKSNPVAPEVLLDHAYFAFILCFSCRPVLCIIG
jgi:hypothetical protein